MSANSSDRIPPPIHKFRRRHEDQYAVIERHIGTILGALILASVLWVGSNLTANIETTARTDVRLGNIEEDIGELKGTINGRMSDRWTGTQAKEQMIVHDKRFAKLETWNAQAEHRIDTLELITSVKRNNQ